MRLSLTGTEWRLLPVDEAAQQGLMRAGGVGSHLARCLLVRGVDGAEAMREVFHPQLRHLHDPEEMSGMPEAVARIQRAVRDGERVRVVTDYDVDGTTSSLILQATLQILGLPRERLSYHIPHRMTEGYGFSTLAAQAAVDADVDLILTADIGVRDHEAVEIARRGGVEVIICDHHLPPGEDVPASAEVVLCPPQQGCSYPNKALAACGVSLKLAQALLRSHPKQAAIVASMMKLAAIGTVADVVDLFNLENRAIVSLGLQALNADRHGQGLEALLDVSGVPRGKISTTHLGYQIGPRINAAGRLDSAMTVIECLTSRDPHQARLLAQELEKANRERRTIQDHILRAALQRVPDPVPPFVVVSGSAEEGWHKGVVGIVAGRLRDRLHRPVAVVALAGDPSDPSKRIGTASVRSTETVHAVRALDTVSDLLLRYGGHAQAAGFSVDAASLENLAQRLSEAAWEQQGETIPLPIREVDTEVYPSDLDASFMRELQRLAPFGKGNPQPRLLVRSAQIRRMRILSDKHLSFELGDGYAWLRGIWWGAVEHVRHFHEGAQLDLLGKLEWNDYRGRRSLQFILDDARIPEA